MNEDNGIYIIFEKESTPMEQQQLTTSNKDVIVFLIIAIYLILLSFSDISLKLLMSVCKSPFSEECTKTISAVLWAYSLFFFGLALISYRFSLKGKSFVFEIVDQIRILFSELQEDIRLSVQNSEVLKWDIVFVIAAVVIAIVIRLYFLSQPMRYDESFTYLNFSAQDIASLFYYPLPNNHILHTILVRSSTSVWGGHPAVIRLPAFLAGIASVPLTFCLCRMLVQGSSGVFASVAMAVMPYMVLYSTMARGYSLLVLMTLLLAIIGIYFTEKPSLSKCGLISAISALGMLTVSTMIFSIAGIYLWICCIFFIKQKQCFSKVLREFVIPCAIMTVIFTMILYTPSMIVSGGVKLLVSNPLFAPLTWGDFFSKTYPHFQEIFRDFSRDIPWQILMVGIVLVIAGLIENIQKHNWNIVLLLPSLLLGSGVIFFVQHRIPFVRTWIYLIPFVLMIADAGFTFVSKKYFQVFCFLIIILGAGFAASLILKNAISEYPDTGYFPEAPVIATYLKPLIHQGDTVHVRQPADWSMYFYFWYYNVTASKKKISDSDVENEFFIVDTRGYSIKSMTDKPVFKLFEVGKAALYQTPAPEKK